MLNSSSSILLFLLLKTLCDYTMIIQCERLPVIYTIIQNMQKMPVIVILRIRCKRYFKLCGNQALWILQKKNVSTESYTTVSSFYILMVLKLILQFSFIYSKYFHQVEYFHEVECTGVKVCCHIPLIMKPIRLSFGKSSAYMVVSFKVLCHLPSEKIWIAVL